MQSDPLQFGLKQSTIEQITHVLQQYAEIERTIIYGSRAKGNYRPGSDIDLTLMGQGLTHGHLLQIEQQLDDLLLPYLFDLSIFSHIENPDMIAHIDRVGLLFYERTTNTQPA
ncbi:nucleotidyltransferase domain-containing protein [Leptolyngbya cf. ectocarpi LEGE 11479]|uniref:Nucleotidyltransferase domain-containing protein n=1 Tax=Leptolyngbya cf. ectocarpi LEGE 11479 TaxID=1828722 RepID=A0A928ZZ70_LEPEC|nr:nucleotidyltransferase domain-containing protein [Leptolyngbya ectocarpi]MBE9070170.1 nucleotidyltransferase domain-containing protein [Leptolyngbya cf. ectocarpi LEGE 11479]